jgi:hypothetical protein
MNAERLDAGEQGLDSKSAAGRTIEFPFVSTQETQETTTSPSATKSPPIFVTRGRERPP